MSEVISITFNNTIEDYVAADKLYYSSTNWTLVDKIVSILLFACGVYFVINAGIRWWTIIWFPLAIAEWFNLLSMRKLTLRFWYKRNPKFKDAYNLTFSEQGINFRTASIDSDIKWSLYKNYIENERLFVLVYGSRAYTVIPKSALSNDTGVQELRGLLERKIKKGSDH